MLNKAELEYFLHKIDALSDLLAWFLYCKCKWSTEIRSTQKLAFGRSKNGLSRPSTSHNNRIYDCNVWWHAITSKLADVLNVWGSNLFLLKNGKQTVSEHSFNISPLLRRLLWQSLFYSSTPVGESYCKFRTRICFVICHSFSSRGWRKLHNIKMFSPPCLPFMLLQHHWTTVT